MTPAQIVTAARNKTNASSDTFYSDTELYGLIDEAILELFGSEYTLEDVDTSISTVSGTRSYTLPASTISIKRIEWGDEPLTKIDGFRDDDSLTADNPNTTATGTPRFWYEFADLIYLRPIPDSVATLRLFRFKAPTLITTATQTIQVPVQFHRGITSYLAAQQSLKDEDYPAADRHISRWDKTVEAFKSWAHRRKITGGFRTVKAEELYP